MKECFKNIMIACVGMVGAISVTSASAKDANETKYEATLTGMVCASCRAHVTHAIQSLPNTSEIKITKGSKEGTQLVSFVTKASNLQSDQITQALGEEGKRYQVLSLEKK